LLIFLLNSQSITLPIQKIVDFGKLTTIEGVDFSLPAEHKATLRLLQTYQPVTTPEIYVGCPVWACKEWQGHLYPANTPEKQFLYHYTRQFNTIELNTTHYRVPDEATIQRWYEQAGAGFRFCPKLLQAITHEYKLLGAEAQQLTTLFLGQVAALKEKLGVVFMQLPPYFSPNDFAALEQFLKLNFATNSVGKQQIPAIDFAIEFRHQAWFSDARNFEKAAQLLENHAIATVICDVAGRRDVLHQRLTTPTLVLRFVGNGLHPTDYTRTDEWIRQLSKWFEQGLQKAYLFIHEPDNTKAPEMAAYWVSELNKHCGAKLKKPQFYGGNKGGGLFG
jgi:uncharacterized protein YecE (DUF72 family)